MPTLKCNSTFGNFKWTAECNVTDEQMLVLANAGLLQVLQRSPASRAEKVLAGYEKRPDKFNRSSIEFSDEAAKTLSTELGKAVEIAEGIEIVPTISVSEHVIGESTTPKFVEEKQIVARHVAKGDLAEWASTKIKFAGDTVDADGNPTTEFLQAVKNFKIALLKAQ
jgi:hypothetical protein